jgi:Zn-dependent protease with chaperone function
MEEAVMSSCLSPSCAVYFLLAGSAVAASQSGRLETGAAPYLKGCGLQYEQGIELTLVDDARIQSLFADLLMRAGVTEPVLLCADIPPEQKNFAEIVRRSDGHFVVAISRTLTAFADDEISGVLGHELGHLLAGAVGRGRPPTVEEYLREEGEADVRAASLVGPQAVCAAVKRAYEMSVLLGFESDSHVLRRYRDQRLQWIARTEPVTARKRGPEFRAEDLARASKSKCSR